MDGKLIGVLILLYPFALVLVVWLLTRDSVRRWWRRLVDRLAGWRRVRVVRCDGGQPGA